MTFDEFLTSRGVQPAEAAERLERDQTLIGRYRRRKVTPSGFVMAKIFEWSGGEVTPPELLALQAEPAE